MRATSDARRVIQRMSTKTGRELSSASRALVAVTVFVLASAPFLRAVTHPFLAWDDDLNFTQNAWIQGLSTRNLEWMFTSFHVGHYMPLTWLSCALEYELWGLDPARFHAVNIALHALTAVLLLAATRELLQRVLRDASEWRIELASAAGALLFAVHPLRVESVAWATERRDVLAGALLALSVLAWLCMQRNGARRRAWYAVSLLAFACSLLSKVAGMSLPVALLVLDAWPLQRWRERSWRALIFEKLPYFALAAAGAALGLLGQARSAQVLASLTEHSLAQRIAQSAYALCFYWLKTLWPSDLSAFYELPPTLDPRETRFVLAIVAVVVVTSTLFAARRRTPALRSAWTTWLAFAVLVAPVVGLVTSGMQIAADRYTYFAAFALVPACAALLATIAPRFSVPAAAAVIAALSALTWRQTGFWSSTRTLFQRIVQVEPASHVGHHKLGVLAHQAGEFQRAMKHYDRCIEARWPDTSPDVHYDRALTWLALGDPANALSDLNNATAIRPTHVAALRVLADLELQRGDPGPGVERFRRALTLAPNDVALRIELTGALLARQRYAEALETAQSALELAPRDVQTLNRAGLAALYLQRAPEAEVYLRRAATLDPSEPSVLFNLGLAQSKQGRSDEANENWRRVLELEPGHAGARAKLEAAPRN